MTRFFNPETICQPFNPYTHGAEIEPGSRLVYFAGQVGADINGDVPPGFEDQTRGTYQNIEAILKDADMDLSNLVKLTTFLTDRENLPRMRDVRKEMLGDHKPAHTLLIVAGLAYPEFLIEVEGFAAAPA